METSQMTVECGLLRPKDAAQWLAVSPRMLWKLTAGREIPCVRIGRSVRYDLADLRAWIEARKMNPIG
jgi:excisionase family DNA binding protein